MRYLDTVVFYHISECRLFQYLQRRLHRAFFFFKFSIVYILYIISFLADILWKSDICGSSIKVSKFLCNVIVLQAKWQTSSSKLRYLKFKKMFFFGYRVWYYDIKFDFFFLKIWECFYSIKHSIDIHLFWIYIKKSFLFDTNNKCYYSR